MVTPILIDAGPSPRGWSRIESFLRCPMLFYWRHVANRPGPERPQLARGSIGHVGLAHWYARSICQRKGIDPDRFYPSAEAMARQAAAFGDTGAAVLMTAMGAVGGYTKRYHDDLDRFEVLGIEKLLETEFGGYRYTARADLIIRMGGRVYIIDHKFTGRIESRVFRRYVLSGQFLGLWHLGSRAYGSEFGGCLVNVIGCEDGQYERREMDPAPFALRRFPSVIAEAESRLAELESLPADRWPMALSEQACITPYGICDQFESCRWGP